MCPNHNDGTTAPGPATPSNDNATGHGRVVEGHGTEDSRDCADSRLDKQLRQLQTLAALHGIGVYALADGALLVSRWGLARAVPDVCALAQLLAQMGVL